MKIQYLALSALALWPACASAQTPTASHVAKAPLAPPVIEPAAQALLDRATQSYKGASGISYTVANIRTSTNGKQRLSTTTVRYSLPGKLNVIDKTEKSSSGVLADGTDMYLIGSPLYYKSPTSPEAVKAMMTSRSKSGLFVGSILSGDNPVVLVQRIYSDLSPKDFKMGKVVALGARLVDGEMLQGLRYSFSARVELGDEKEHVYDEEVTAWFGGSPFLLRRVQTRTTLSGKSLIQSEKILDQQLSPRFAPDDFKFSDKGLELASDEDDNKPYWDERLKVGTAPFAFSAKDVNGQTISLDKYRGKVVLLDFWATWCGPCVAGLPELKGAYDKYHGQGLEVVGISLDDDKKALTSFTKSRKMAWPQLFDGKAWKSPIPVSYGVKGIPFLLLVGKDGKIAAVNPRGNIDKAVKAALAKK